jgi:hypothetical protein
MLAARVEPKNGPKENKEIGNFKPLVLSQFQAAVDSHIRALSGSDVYRARVGIAASLKAAVSQLKIASAGPTPVAGKPDARIRLDRAGRYFVVRFRGGPTLTGFPISK